MPALVGSSLDTGDPVYIDEHAPMAGLYVLGKPRTGKSWLLINLIRQDVDAGHGVFFLDPHGGAIFDLLSRYPSSLCLADTLLIDPADPDFAVGVNPLSCRNVTSLGQRSNAFKRTKALFDRLWKSSFEEKPWLQLILQNTIYAFIENQGFTVADFPIFFTDVSFRTYICNNVQHNAQVRDFWLTHFPNKPKHDQAEIISAAQTRLEIMLAHPYVRHVLGQSKCTIDFAEVVEQKKVVLVLFSSRLADEVKKILGTVYLTELLDAVEGRTTRDQFSIFGDEFQNFAGFEDFATLITRAPKLGVATTLAHHERRGQLSNDPRVLGATAVIPNKIFFQVTQRDAEEFAAEFAGEPPTETRREQELVISPSPVAELLSRGHKDPDIRAFAVKYLRHIRDSREDVKEDMEAERLRRLSILDEAALLAADERLLAMGMNHDLRQKRLTGRRLTLEEAAGQTKELLRLLEAARSLRLTERGVNAFLVGVMEGRVRRGQEEFAAFLIDLVQGISGISADETRSIALYIEVTYGSAASPRMIPYELAKEHGLYHREVAILTYQAQEKTRAERLRFEEAYLSKEAETDAAWRKQKNILDRRAALENLKEQISARRLLRSDIMGGRTGLHVGKVNRLGSPFLSEKNYLWNPPNIYLRFVWYHDYRPLRTLLAPYEDAKLAGLWQQLLPASRDVPGSLAKTLKSLEIIKPLERGHEDYMTLFKSMVIPELNRFLLRYKEGAFVMLALLDCAASGCWGLMKYGNLTMLELPGLERVDPVELWCSIEQLRSFMYQVVGRERFLDTFARYYTLQSSDDSSNIEQLRDCGFFSSIYNYPVYDCIKSRDDVRALESQLKDCWDWFAANHGAAAAHWKIADACARYYFLCRAADEITCGAEYRCLPLSIRPAHEELIAAFVSLSRDCHARLDAEEERREAARFRRRLEAECAEKSAEIAFRPPELLEPRVLRTAELQEVRNACLERLGKADQQVRDIVATIDEFARFCALLAKPKNHILVPSGQYTEKTLRSRTEADMAGEVVRELAGLGQFSALVKIGAYKGRIKTFALEQKQDREARVPPLARAATLAYCGSARASVEHEIAERQKVGRQRPTNRLPPRIS